MKQPVDRRILVVEDHEAVLLLFTQVLGREGFRVSSATTREQATGLIARMKFDLLICDLSIGGRRGAFDIIAMARQEQPKLPVIVATGSGDHDVAAEVQSIGAEFMLKPFSASDLLSKISTMMSQRKSPAA